MAIKIKQRLTNLVAYKEAIRVKINEMFGAYEILPRTMPLSRYKDYFYLTARDFRVPDKTKFRYSSCEYMPKLDTASVRDFSSMFASCSQLKQISPMERFPLDMSLCNDCTDMFYMCSNLEEVHLINFGGVRGMRGVLDFSQTKVNANAFLLEHRSLFYTRPSTWEEVSVRFSSIANVESWLVNEYKTKGYTIY